MDKPESTPDSVKAARDRAQVVEYQARFLTRKFNIPMSQALVMIHRHGISRTKLLGAVSRELGR
jgi:hypothetical protein